MAITYLYHFHLIILYIGKTSLFICTKMFYWRLFYYFFFYKDALYRVTLTGVLSYMRLAPFEWFSPGFWSMSPMWNLQKVSPFHDKLKILYYHEWETCQGFQEGDIDQTHLLNSMPRRARFRQDGTHSEHNFHIFMTLVVRVLAKMPDDVARTNKIKWAN